MEEIFEKLDLKKIIERTINYSITDAGRNRLRSEKPTKDLSDASYLLSLTDELKSFIEEYGDLNFVYIPDLKEVIHKSKIENFILNPKDIIQIGKLLYNSRFIKTSLAQHKNRFGTLWSLVEKLAENKFLEKKINEIFDDYGEVRDSASDDLRKIREEITSLQFQIQKINEKILKNLSKDGMVQDELITLRDGRMVIPVRSEFKRKVRGFIHSESATGQTTYIEPAETLELNNELLSLFFEEKREIQRILSLLTKDISKFSNELLSNFEIISIFDAHYAKAKYAIEIRANKINFSEDKSFELIDCRHPLLIQSLGYNNTIAFNLKLDRSIKGIVISGPNAGGKTVLMKTIGTIAILTRMGYLISSHPDSRFPFFKKVFIDIGDEQSIDNDISTFGSHIKNLRYIYENADDDSLVLLDELGTGTDPIQGAALAASYIEELIKKNSFLIVTTHHSFLKFFAANHPELINSSMEFDSDTLEPTYRFIQGVPGSSYTFEIARRMKLDEKIISGAKKYLKRNEIEIENYISQLQQKVQYYSKLINELRKEKEEIQKLKNELNSKLSNIKKENREIKKKALLEAEQILKTANKIVEKAIREIRESKADKHTIKNVKAHLEDEKSKLYQLIRNSVEDKSLPDEEIKIGDIVKFKDQETFGKVISIDKKKNQAQVQVEQFKVTVSLDKIFKYDYKEKFFEEASSEKPQTFIETKTIPFRLDIRGKRAAEAEELIYKYLDDAVMYGLFNVEILHGKGDGILKSITHKVLQSHPFVESFHFAPIDQGGEGITIVKLKD
ncbi:MAG: endonuclease MutS2 [Ignavibacteria bacterium]